ncbi:MAG: peptidylprolyl isomerase [Deltaproteobacteria bacterium]|nr:MAG: peptidylprolyl isomerase [Deltaproteobacteria bacterium]
MTTAAEGNTVKVHYTGRLEDGTVFDSSMDREPLAFEVGSGMVIPGFENGVKGMAVGEKKTLTIPPESAYGRENRELIVSLPKDQFPPEIPLEVGQRLQHRRQDGGVINVIITAVSDTAVTVDANPPLAGKTLIFDIELMEIG